MLYDLLFTLFVECPKVRIFVESKYVLQNVSLPMNLIICLIDCFLNTIKFNLSTLAILSEKTSSNPVPT